MSSYFDHNGHVTLLQPYGGETHRAGSYFFCYDSLKSARCAEIYEGSVIRTSSVVYPYSEEGGEFFMDSVTKFKCNFTVIGVVHLGIKMAGCYFSEFRWDENCCNRLNKYQDFPTTRPFPQYAQMITQGWSNVHFIDQFPVNWYRNKEFLIV